MIRSILQPVLLLACLVVLVACGDQQVPLTGRVLNAYTKQPVVGAQVRFGAQPPITTSKTGHYRAEAWDTDQMLQVEAPGYEPLKLRLADMPAHTQITGASLPVPLEVHLRPHQLTGVVSDPNTHRPIAAARVWVSDTLQTTTDTDGRYTLENVPETFEVVVTAPGYAEVRARIERRQSFDIALLPNVLRGVVKTSHTDQALGGVTVTAGELATETAADGTYELHGVNPDTEVHFAREGYTEARQHAPQSMVLDAGLLPNVLRGLVKDAQTGKPLAGVTVSAGELSTETSGEGAYELRGVTPDTEVRFARRGYKEAKQPAPQSMVLDVTLQPERVPVSGRVIDARNGQPLAEVELIVSTTSPGSEVMTTRTDAEGRFTLDKIPADATVTALLPGYARGRQPLVPADSPIEIQLEPFEAKALYLAATRAALGMPVVNTYFDIIDGTELNAMVLDLKSDIKDNYGVVYYQSQAPAVVAAGTSADLMPIREILAEAKRRGIYMIARIQIFAHDNALLQVYPDWYVQRNGAPFFADGGVAWLDPYDERVWDYNIQLAVEAAQLGFDEIQFDYIRFPSDGNLNGIVFKGPYTWATNPQPMYDVIGRFAERAHRAINNAGAFFSVDVFGYTAWSPIPAIGQNVQVMAQHVDYVYPMVYPSHYSPNELGLPNAAASPYEIVDHSLRLISNQMQGSAGRAKVRPWLQDFTMNWGAPSQRVPYGATEVRAQIDAAEANRGNGARGWALWNLNGTVTVGALKAP